jgi:hypothetical protein
MLTEGKANLAAAGTDILTLCRGHAMKPYGLIPRSFRRDVGFLDRLRGLVVGVPRC